MVRVRVVVEVGVEVGGGEVVSEELNRAEVGDTENKVKCWWW